MTGSSTFSRRGVVVALIALVVLLVAAVFLWRNWAIVQEVTELAAKGSSTTLRERPPGTPHHSPQYPALLIIALDGVDRELLYDLLREGEMPELAGLLGGSKSDFQQAYFDSTMLSTLPSITLAAWSSIFTGEPPSVHGVTGNEFFDRRTRSFIAPAPVSINAPELIAKTYSDGYLNDQIHAPTVYEKMRERDPDVLIWIAMNQVYRGADELIITSRAAIVETFAELFAEVAKEAAGDEDSKQDLYANLDSEVVEEVLDKLESGTVPDVLTVYLPGTDLYAHVAKKGPESARREFLREKVDPELGKLQAGLQRRGALANRFVVVVGDHGHTEVVHDEEHSLAMDSEDDPPALLKALGRRLRPFEIDVEDDDDFDTVLAYQGAMAYVYLADCPLQEAACDWTKPPSEETVLAVADSFYRNNIDGSLVLAMKGVLDLVLTREAVAPGQHAKPFRVYVGDGKSQAVADFLRENPRQHDIEFEERLKQLASGPRGDHAGDIILFATNGNRDKPSERFYFASPYRSWHGSASRQDSQIPLIVAHPTKTTDELARLTDRALAGRRWQQAIADVLIQLRYGE